MWYSVTEYREVIEVILNGPEVHPSYRVESLPDRKKNNIWSSDVYIHVGMHYRTEMLSV